MEEKLNSERRSFVAFTRTICVSASSSVDTQTRERFYLKLEFTMILHSISKLFKNKKTKFSDFSFYNVTIFWSLYSLTVNRVSFGVVVETRRLRAVISSSGKH